MIRCNLSVLLAERHLRISKVSQDTGISRTTLTALANNYGKGIQFDTIDTLCLYLRTTPDQLINFAPVAIENITAATDKNENGMLSTEISMDIVLYGKRHKSTMGGNICIDRDRGGGINDVQIDLELWDETANPDADTKESNLYLNKAFGVLTRSFIEDIANIVEQKVIDSLEKLSPVCGEDGEIYKDYRIADGYSVSFSWPFDDWGKA